MGIQNISQDNHWSYPILLGLWIQGDGPIEVDIPTHWRLSFSPKSNDELMNASLDLIEEKMEDAELRTAVQKQKIALHYNARV